MSQNYDNWERLVRAVLRRQHDREIALCPSFDSMSSSSRLDFDESAEGIASGLTHFMPVITVTLTRLAMILEEQIWKEFKLVSGVGKEVNKLMRDFESIKAVLVDAETRWVNEESVKVWLDKIKDVSYDTEDVMYEWITATRMAKINGLQTQSSPTTKVRSFFTLPRGSYNRVALQRDIAIKIKNINQRVTSISIERERYKFNITQGNKCLDSLKTTSDVDVSGVRGRKSEIRDLIGQLTPLWSKKSKLNVVSIIGLGGIGKTTLAQVAFNSSKVIREFGLRIWVHVSEPFDVVRIGNAILENMGEVATHLHELETTAQKIRRYIDGQKFLLVLDDVWTDDFRKWEHLWNSLQTSAPGSTILVTTRNEQVAKVMGSTSSNVIWLEEMLGHNSLALFKKIAFHEIRSEDRAKFEDVGLQISDKCKGFPHIIKTIASLMRFKKSLQEWNVVLDTEFWALEQAGELFQPLMSRYYNLHTSMKQCFLFFAVFPKYHVIKADDLVKLWMAQGYLNSAEADSIMEDLGHEYLQNLAMLSFFQDMKTEKDGKRVISIKMHAIVHDFVQYLTKNDSSFLVVNSDLEQNIQSSHRRVRHLRLIRSKDGPFPKVPSMERLSTYCLQSYYSPPIWNQHDTVEAEFFGHLPRLRALDLSHNQIGGLAKEIGNLVLLKFLNLSNNPIQELPASLCELYNLQTLKLFACSRLRELPQGIRKLVNLRHVEIDRTDSLNALPKGIGKMEALQTLSKFVLGHGKDAVEATCGIEDLNKLNNLRGCLKLEGLGYVRNGDEAKKAKLQKKRYLFDIEMDFGAASQIDRQEEVIEVLQPQENVQKLQISSYEGLKLPNWIMALTNLQKLSLRDCTNCTDLPPLGRLPSLKTLHIEGMNSVKVIGLEFLGVGSNTMYGSDALSEVNLTAFPMLKKLTISKMENWEEWKVESNDGASQHFNIVPRLRCLEILHCMKLKALPAVILENRSPWNQEVLRIEHCSLEAVEEEEFGKWNGPDGD